LRYLAGYFYSVKKSSMRLRLLTLSLSVFFLVFTSCDNNEDDPSLKKALLREAIVNYADIVHANYEDARDLTMVLHDKIHDFVDAPSEAGLTAAKTAWLAAREAYGQTEAFRLYGGPVDDEDGPEGRMNAWPMDESYIDYVEGSANGEDGENDGSNIINNTEEFPSITKEVVGNLNEAGSESNISSGYHAIEFLLWGQDLSDGAGGGTRPYTDYVAGEDGTNENQQRRGAYLEAVADLLVDDLNSLVDEWHEQGTYRSEFISDDELENSLEKLVSGIGKLSKGELAGERMFVAWDLKSKENEHSCFSDNTHRDIVNNAKGIQNVILGSYTRTDGSVVSGPGVYDLVKVLDKALAEELKALSAKSVAACEDIEGPFDQEFKAEPGRTRIKDAIDLLREQGDKLADAADAFGFTFDPSDI
jgi:putative iron-regulated protein